MISGGNVSVLQVVWRLSATGGIPEVVRRVLKGLDRGLFDVHVCTARPIGSADRVEELGPGITFHTLGVEGQRTPISRTLAAARLLRVIRRVRPDLVHVHSGITWLLVPAVLITLRNKPLIVEVHDSPSSGRVSRANWAVERWLLRRRASVAVVHSNAVESELVSAVGVDRAKKCWNIPIGMPLPSPNGLQAGSEWRRRHQIGPDVVIVSHLGRLVPSKRPEAFVHLASEVSGSDTEVVFVLAGDGPNLPKLQRLADSLGVGDRLRITGREPDVPGLLAASQIFVSTSEYEGFGMAILEAMSASTSVVATNVGATGELVVDGVTGLLVELGDGPSLRHRVEFLLENPDVRERMAVQGRRTAENLYDVRTMVGRYQDLYLALGREQGLSNRGSA